ncbi:MAG: hypothetical protein Q7S75_01865 [bacterium]|nr:hypothetical protein [bacterium]
MEFISRNKWIFLGLGVVVAGFFWYASSGTSAPADLLTTEGTVSPASPADNTLVETLLTLRAITLSGHIFSDTTFQSLKDFGTEIIPEPIGRADPFAPLNQDSAQSVGTTDEGAKLFTPANSR